MIKKADRDKGEQKIQEALEIIVALGLPRQQQNERSGLKLPPPPDQIDGGIDHHNHLSLRVPLVLKKFSLQSRIISIPGENFAPCDHPEQAGESFISN